MANNSEIVVKPLEIEKLHFPQTPDTVKPRAGEKIKTTIAHCAVRDAEGKTALDIASLPVVLGTDKPGAKRFYSDLENDDKFSAGGRHYVRLPALRKEVDVRIEQPHAADKRERLKHVSDCLSVVRDNPTSEQLRAVNEVAIRRGQKQLKQQKIARDGTTHCEMSGQPLQPDAEVHHEMRRADNPDLALNLDNLKLVNPQAHKEHHQKEQQEAESFGK